MNPFANGPAIQPGDPAPSFTVRWIEREGSVSLSDYRGRPVLLALARGLWCPFCRRALAALGGATDDLAKLGVATLGIVATDPANARLYLRYRPSRVPLAADAAMDTHGAYGLPRPPMTPELMAAVETVRTDAGGELPEPVPLTQASQALNGIDGFTPSAEDFAEMEHALTQLTGHFLVDGQGRIRWTDVECARDGLAGMGRFPSDDEILEAARALA